VVGACCIPNNICVAADDYWDPEVEEEEGRGDDDGGEDPNEDAGHQHVSGSFFRVRLAAQVSAPAELPVYLHEHDYI